MQAVNLLAVSLSDINLAEAFLCMSRLADDRAQLGSRQ